MSDPVVRRSLASMPATGAEEWGSDTGAIAIIAALLIAFALIGLAAIATDIGFVAQKRDKLQVAADSAALAAASTLPGNPSSAQVVAASYAAKNATLSKPIDFSVSGNTVYVTAYGDAPLGLAKVWGKDSQPARATASAKVGSPTAIGHGLMPFALMARGSKVPPYGLPVASHGEIVLETSTGSAGNYHMVDLTGFTAGASNSKQVISGGGTTSPVSIGTTLQLQTGTPDNPNYGALNSYMSCSHTFADLFDANGLVTPPTDSDGDICNRVIAVPVVVLAGLPEPDCYNWESAKGASIPVTVIGFAHAFIEGSASPSTKTLWIGETTVKTHVSNLLRKLGQPDRTQAVLAAVRAGLVVLNG